MLRQWLRKWLCLDDQTAAIKAEVNKEVAEALSGIMSIQVALDYRTTMSRSWRSYLEDIAKNWGWEGAQSAIDEFREKVNAESFIDSVVERINRKQVGGKQ